MITVRYYITVRLISQTQHFAWSNVPPSNNTNVWRASLPVYEMTAPTETLWDRWLLWSGGDAGGRIYWHVSRKKPSALYTYTREAQPKIRPANSTISAVPHTTKTMPFFCAAILAGPFVCANHGNAQWSKSYLSRIHTKTYWKMKHYKIIPSIYDCDLWKDTLRKL